MLYCRKHFYSILTNLSNLSHSKSSTVPFAKFKSDLKNILTKHFPTRQLFANVLQNRNSYKFPDIHKKISVLESLLIKLHTWWPATLFKKQTPAQVFSCEYHKMYENGFLYRTPLLVASENGLIISKNFPTWEIFVQKNS